MKPSITAAALTALLISAAAASAQEDLFTGLERSAVPAVEAPAAGAGQAAGEPILTLREALRRQVQEAREALAEMSKDSGGRTYLEPGYEVREREQDGSGTFVAAGRVFRNAFRGTADSHGTGFMWMNVPSNEFTLDAELAAIIVGPVKALKQSYAASAGASDRYLLDTYAAAVGALAALRIRKSDAELDKVQGLAIQALGQADAKLAALETILRWNPAEPALRTMPSNGRDSVQGVCDLLQTLTGATPAGDAAKPALVDKTFEQVAAGTYSLIASRAIPHRYGLRQQPRALLQAARKALDTSDGQGAWLASMLDELLAPLEAGIEVPPGLGSADVARNNLSRLAVRTQVALRVLKTWLGWVETDAIGSDFGRPASQS